MKVIRATGQVIPELEEPITETRIRELRAPELNAGFLEREKIADRNYRETYKTPQEQLKQAAEDFDARNPTLVKDPVLLVDLWTHTQREVNDAVARGRAVDWNSAFNKAGVEVSRAAGLSTAEERERAQVLDDLRSSRGIK